MNPCVEIKPSRPPNIEAAIGMLYSLIIRFPDLDDMLRPIVQELEKSGR